MTNERGEAVSKELEIGRYKIKEKETTHHYLLNEEERLVTIKDNNEIKMITIENEPAIPDLKIDKQGPEEVEKEKEIEYGFEIKNKGNTSLDHFTWIEYIPYEKVTITKMQTGTYNFGLTYQIFYKTNQRDYQLLKTENSKKNDYIDFTSIQLNKKEKITEIKVEYGTVPVGFKNVIQPMIAVKTNKDLKTDEIIVNVAKLTGDYCGYPLEEETKVKTKIKERKIEKKLPRTGK